MQPILVMELRGFSASATDLSRELESIGITPERVRASGIEIIKDVIEECKLDTDFSKSMHLGGDTWYWNFQSMPEAVGFATRLLGRFYDLAVEQGIYYIKPSVALGYGDPKFDGDRFLDDDSIATYRTADGGLSYTLFVVGKAIPKVRELGYELTAHPKKFTDNEEVKFLDWTLSKPDSETQNYPEIRLPSLLLDSDIIYSDSNDEALANLIRYQNDANSAYVFGGPVHLDDPTYAEYLSSTIKLLNQDNGCKFTILSFLPMDEPELSYSWLELCRQISLMHPRKFAFSAFSIPKGQLRPFSYHVYGENSVHIGLRSYSPQRGVPTMSSSIMFKNKHIADRFSRDFLESFRSTGAMDDKAYSKLVARFSKISPEVKGRVQKRIFEILSTSN